MDTERSNTCVVNTHVFGSVDKLPAGTVYIGRPSFWGNSYSMKSGRYTREECVALHRIDLYRDLIKDPGLFTRLQQDLQGHDLACWCKQPKKVLACHGDTYVHILSDKNLTRDYTKSIVFYLMDDLRSVVSHLEEWVKTQVSIDDYLSLYIHLGDVRVCLDRALLELKNRKLNPESLYFFLALLTIDLELAKADTNLDIIHYRLDHAIWQVYRFTYDLPELYPEPVYPL